MSGQHEQRTELDGPAQPDQSDVAPEESDLIDRLLETPPANGSNLNTNASDNNGSNTNGNGGNGSAVIAGGLKRLPSDHPAPPPPKPGSLADLKQRLERLPYGHPSSPYHSDGEPKPPPPRLKHLELAPPPISRFAAPQMLAPIDLEPDSFEEFSPKEPSTEDPEPVDVSKATALPPAVTNFDGSWTWGFASLTADQARTANEAYDKFRAAEGRNLFGSYGSTGLTVVVSQIAADLEYGQLAPAAEQNCLLDADSFKARFADLLARYPDRTAERLSRRVAGAISYSFIFDREHYSGGIGLVQGALAARGFQLLARRNDWPSPANRCVATMWQDPSSGLPFEVQFHTAASLEAQQLTRTSVTLISDPRIPAAEAANLRADLAAAWAAVPAPPGNGQIEDYRRKPPTPVASPGPDLDSGPDSRPDSLSSGLPPDRSTP